MSKKIFKSDIAADPHDKPVKVEKWDWNAVKNALDDGTRKFLIGQDHFKEDHRLMNFRLIISTLAVVFSGIAMLYDWLHPFPLSKTVMLFCVIAYFITVGILTYYITYVEKGCSVAAKQLDEAGIDKPNLWRVYSKQKRYEPNYLIEVEYENGTTKKIKKGTFEASVGKFFDENGSLVTNNLYTELAAFFEGLARDGGKKDK